MTRLTSACQLGGEVGRALDWIVDSDKVLLNVSRSRKSTIRLLGVFDSRSLGGKRYDLATMGRRRANATYFESHGVDNTTGLSYAMDLTPLMTDAIKITLDFVQEYIHRFAQDVAERIHRIG